MTDHLSERPPLSDSQKPRQVFELADQGFNIMHDPRDTDPCEVDEDGICYNINHLFPVSKKWSVPNA